MACADKGENQLPYYYYYDYSYILMILPAVLFALWAQLRVKSTFHKYSEVRNARGITGAEAARAILDQNGLYSIRVEPVQGRLTDHYDPRAGVIRLSEDVYHSTSVAALGVAAHESGHAVQHSVGYGPLKLRNTIIPITQLGSRLSFPLILAGLLFSYNPIILAGIVLFSVVVFFQLVTLPVEYNASSRAMQVLETNNMLYGEELTGARKVLSAAALTYVAATLSAIASLLRLLLIFGRRSNNR